ncbi:MAG: sigma-70 family RNA polymerase sigma factor [Thermomicrobiales bacterium]|nr:sigma-70 family RNA polymerase sigma factor [Thermomicrobiales bacterium]MCO5218986.1 sigma-70 family RNA polymerase sigma factor [Thermomicrobiales bacterium]
MLKPKWRQFGRQSATDPEALTDDDLVRRAQQDSEQFGELYRRYAPEIERFVRSRVSDPYLAEDITSKVFTKALLALPQFTEGSFRAWLYRITRNTIIDEYRRTKPNVPIDDLPLESSIPQPDDIAIANDAADRLRRALEHLKPNQREIVRLRLHGLSVKEIAERLQMSENAVKSAQRRAFIALKSVPGVMP